MIKKWKIVLGALGLIGAGVGTTLLVQQKLDKKIASSDKYLNEAKQYVLDNLDGEIKSSYIYKDENNSLHGCINLEKDNHIYNHKFAVIANSVVFV